MEEIIKDIKTREREYHLHELGHDRCLPGMRGSGIWP